MVLIISIIIIIGIIFFFKLFYGSFIFGKIIYFFNSEISSVELIFCLYFFLTINLFFIFKNNAKLFLDKGRIVKLFILHLVTTIFLLIIGEYTFSIFLQFIFLLSIFRSKNLFNCMYIFCINYTLLLIFASAAFILYFILLLLSAWLVFKEEFVLKIEGCFICIAISFFITIMAINTKEYIYELYIWLDVVDDISPLSIDVVLLLSILHVVILVSIKIKKKKNVLFKKD